MENLIELLEKQDKNAWDLVSTDLESKILASLEQTDYSNVRYALIDLDTRLSQGFSKELLNQMVIRAERSKMRLGKIFLSEKDLNTVKTDWTDSPSSVLDAEDLNLTSRPKFNITLSSSRPTNLETNFAFGIATNDEGETLVIVGVTGEALLQ